MTIFLGVLLGGLVGWLGGNLTTRLLRAVSDYIDRREGIDTEVYDSGYDGDVKRLGAALMVGEGLVLAAVGGVVAATAGLGTAVLVSLAGLILLPLFTYCALYAYFNETGRVSEFVFDSPGLVVSTTVAAVVGLYNLIARKVEEYRESRQPKPVICPGPVQPTEAEEPTILPFRPITPAEPTGPVTDANGDEPKPVICVFPTQPITPAEPTEPVTDANGDEPKPVICVFPTQPITPAEPTEPVTDANGDEPKPVICVFPTQPITPAEPTGVELGADGLPKPNPHIAVCPQPLKQGKDEPVIAICPGPLPPTVEDGSGGAPKAETPPTV